MEKKIAFLWDRKACEWCNPDCCHTLDPAHAVNFSDPGMELDPPIETGHLYEKAPPPKYTVNLYDEMETYTDCTVQLLRNSVTGKVSVGWWPNDRPPEGHDNGADD